jgi:hypothetical protein
LDESLPMSQVTPQSPREAELTRSKLRSLQARYDDIHRKPSGDTHLRELTLRSLKRHINQLTEELARFEAQTAVKL